MYLATVSIDAHPCQWLTLIDPVGRASRGRYPARRLREMWQGLLLYVDAILLLLLPLLLLL